MNLIGFSLAVKGLNGMSRSSGRGGYYSGGPKGPTDSSYFLADCKDIITECSKMPSMSGTMIPFSTEHKGVNPSTGRKQKTKEEHNIFIAEVNPDCSRFEHMPFDVSNYSVIGMIDNDRIFGLNSKTGRLDVIEVEASYSYGPHGDFDFDYNIIKQPLDKWERIFIRTESVKSAEDIKKGSYSMSNRVEDEKKAGAIVALVYYIRQKKAELAKAESEAQSQGLGE